MRYLFIGDTHGQRDLAKAARAIEEARLSPGDALIHCGDLGAPWAQEDDEALRWWRALPCKKLLCPGNHENHGWLLRQKVVRRFGCRGRDLGGGLFAPLPGQVAVLGGRRFWFYPGGLSIDFFLRRPGRDLFKEELLSPGEARAALDRLRRQAPVDYVVSHDGPREHVMARFGFPLAKPQAAYWRHLGEVPGSRLHPAFVLDTVYRHPEWYGRWYFGHHHRDDAQGKLRCLWELAALEDSRGGALGLIDTRLA